MSAWWGLALVAGAVPVGRAGWAVVGTPLAWAWAWAAAAWVGWCVAVFAGGAAGAAYLALSLTACAGVAVLGARRPGAAAWNFVVAGLLALLCRPYLEGLGQLRAGPAHLAILAAALAVALGNYLPTRQAPAVLLLGAGCGLELATLAGEAVAGWPLAAAAPWAAWLGARRRADTADELWRSFRDRYGFVWAQRAREQFNRAAANAGHAVELGWGGLRMAPGAEVSPAALRALLEATLRRFGGQG